MSRIRNDGAAGETIASGMLWIAGVGVALGLLYNLIGLASEPAFGVPWIGVSPSENVYVLETGNPPDPSAGGEVEYTDIDDPMAVFDSGEAADPDLPEIPELPRPIQIQLPVVKSFFDAGAAMIIDARDPEEYAEGAYPGRPEPILRYRGERSGAAGVSGHRRAADHRLLRRWGLRGFHQPGLGNTERRPYAGHLLSGWIPGLAGRGLPG